MRTTLGHRPTRAALGLAIAGTLTLGLVPLATASADSGTPVTFVDVATHELKTSLDGGTTTSSLGATGERVRTFDVSADGKTIAAAMVTGPESAAVGVDLVYSLVLTTTNPDATVTTKVLSSFSWANPVVTSDSLTGAATAVYWLSPDPDPYNKPNLVRLYKYDVTAGTTAIASTAFVTVGTEYPQRLAVSPKGDGAAVLFDSSTSTTVNRRLLVAPVSTAPTTPWYTSSWSLAQASATDVATGSTFTFVGDVLASGFLFSTEDLSKSYADWEAPSITNHLVSDSAGAGSSAVAGELAGLYSIRPFGGAFVAWKDKSGTVAPDPVTPLTTSRLTLATLVDTNPTVTTWAHGDSTYGYVPSGSTPPALTAAVNPSASSAYLVLPSATALSGRGLAYQSYGFYGAPLVGETGYNQAGQGQSEVDRGVLQWKGVSTTATWSTATWTTGAGAVAPKYLNGTTPRLIRPAYFRWYFPGNRFVAPKYSAAVLAKVAPVVTVSVLARSGKKRVSGRATHPGAYALLYRYSSGAYRYTKIRALISSTGSYNFGFRALSRGSYQVRVLGDRFWAQGAKAFRI